MGAPTQTQIELQLNITDTNFARLRWLVTKASKKVANQVVFERRPGGLVVSTLSQYPDIRVFAYLDASAYDGACAQRVGVGIKLIESAIRGSDGLAIKAGSECQSTFNHLVALNSDLSWFVADRERTGEWVPFPPQHPPRLAHVTDWKDLVKLGSPFLALNGEADRSVLRTMRFRGHMAYVTDGQRAMSLDRSGPWLNGFVHGAVLKLEPRHPAMWLGWDEATNVGVAFRENANVTGYAWQACPHWKHPSLDRVLEEARNRKGSVYLETAVVAGIAAKLKGWSKKPIIVLGEPVVRVYDWTTSKPSENKPDVTFGDTFQHSLEAPLKLNLLYLAELCAASGTDMVELKVDNKNGALSVYASGITDNTRWEHVLMPCATPKKDDEEK